MIGCLGCLRKHSAMKVEMQRKGRRTVEENGTRKVETFTALNHVQKRLKIAERDVVAVKGGKETVKKARRSKKAEY